jgi:hypothetical protein
MNLKHIISTSKLSSGKTDEMNTSNTSYSAGTPMIDPSWQRKIEGYEECSCHHKECIDMD